MRALFVVMLLAATYFGLAQSITHYDFAASAGTYQTLSEGNTIPLSGGNPDDGWFNAIPIGFTFHYMGEPYTTVSASTKGWLTFGSNITNAAYNNLLASGGTRPLVAPLWDDHHIQNDTNFSYQTSGTSPNRIFTAQWSDLRWRNGATTGGISFQVKLYEQNGKVEFIYHQEAGSLSGPSASIGITAAGTGAGNFLSLNNSSDAPVVSSITETTTISAKPAEGQIYTFTPPSGSPAAPVNLSFTDITKTEMTINWTDNSTTENWFNVYFSTDGFSYSLLGTVESTTMTTMGTVYSLSKSSLLPGDTYYYRVTAANEGSAPSTALSGNQSTLSPGLITSVASGNWNATSTWSGGAVPALLDDVTINPGHTVVIDAASECNALTVENTAILRFGTTAQALTVNQEVIVNTGGTFAAGATGGSNLTHTLKIGGSSATAIGNGSLLVNGTFDMYIGSSNGKCNVTFFGQSNTSLSGTGTIDFYRVIMNKGNTTASSTNIPPSLEILSPCSGLGVTTTGFIYTFTAGTIKIGGSQTFENKIFSSTSFTVPALGALWLDNPNFTMTGQSGNPTITGLFRLSDGICNIGTNSNNALGAGASATLLIEGGTLNLSGRFNSTNAMNWIQTGGSVNATTVGNTGSNTAGFGITNSASTFTMSGGTIALVLPNTNTTATNRLDYFNNAGTVIITGGTVEMGSILSGSSKLFLIKGSTPNLVMTNSGGNHSCNLTGNLTVYGNLSLNGTGSFSNNNFSLNMAGMSSSFPGNITIGSGSVFSMNTGSTTLSFTGSYGAQTLTNNGTITSGQLSGLVIQNTSVSGSTVSIPAGLIVAGDGTLQLATGTLQTSGITVGAGGSTGFSMIIGDGQCSGTITRNFGTGTVNYTYNGTQPRITGSELPTSISGTLTISNPAGITFNSSLQAGKLNLVSGTSYTSSSNLLTITGPGTSDLTYTAGMVNGPLCRTIPSSLSSGTTFMFPMGKSTFLPLELVNPITISGSDVLIRAEVFDGATGGTPGTTMMTLDNDHYWDVSIVSGGTSFSSSQVRITKIGLNSNSGLARSAALTGVYDLVSINPPSGNTLTSIALNSFGYFCTGDKGMNYVSSTTTQASTSDVLEGSTDQVIIGIQVVTSGNLDPAVLSSFTFGTYGSTNASDIAAAKVFYTGTNATFSTATPFGNVCLNPSGLFTINGTQTLSEGTNYFWLAYDISLAINDMNVVDAECYSVTVRGTAYTPTVVAPIGSRTIRAALYGSITVGSTGNYPNLTGPNGLFRKISEVGLRNHLNVVIVSDVDEPGTNALTSWYEAGGSDYHITISPDAPVLRTISGGYAGGLIRMNNVSNITIDGRYGGGGKYLAWINSAISGAVAPLHLIGTAVGQGCTSITIRDCLFSNGHNGSNTAGIYLGGASIGSSGYDHDNVSIIDCNIKKSFHGIFAFGISSGTFDNLVVSGDSIGSFTPGEEISRYGIYVQHCPGAQITGNTIFNLRGTISDMFGIYLLAGSINSTISGNMINSVRYLGTLATTKVAGIGVAPGYITSNVKIFNNVITDIIAVGNSNLASHGIAGIRIENGTGIEIYYNSVNLFGELNHPITGDVSAAIYLMTQGDVSIKNNLLRNSLVNTAAGAYAYAIYSDMVRTGFTLIDYNDYHASGTQARLGFCNYSVANNIYQWRAISLQDTHSTDQDPLYATDTDLHIDLASPACRTGNPVPGIDTDFDMVSRHPLTPTMGAYETASDLRGPDISFTPLPNTGSLTSRTLTATITDSTGVPVSGSGLPVLYWRVNNGAWSSSTGVCNGGSQYQFSFGSGVTTGDTVFYFIAAQDTQIPPLVSVKPGDGASGFTSDPPACSVKPVSPAFYRILIGLNGDITVGTGGNYPNLTGTGGLFDVLSQNLLSGNLNARIISDITEPGPFELTQWAEDGAGNFTLTISPDGTTERVISGNLSTGLITLNGAERTIINGGNGDTTSRYLRFRNNYITAPAFRFINGARNNTIRNCHIESGYTGIHLSTSTVSPGNSFNLIAYNDIHELTSGTGIPQYGILSQGSSSYPNANNTISSNNIYNFSWSGVYVSSTGNGGEWLITGNSFFNNLAVPPSTTQRSILFVPGWMSFGNIISYNHIGGKAPLCGGDPWENNGVNNFYGIYMMAGFSSNYIRNNTICNIHQSSSAAGEFYGIMVDDSWVMVSGNTIGHNDTSKTVRNAGTYTAIDGIRIQYPTSTCIIDQNQVINLIFTASSGESSATGIFAENCHVRNNRIMGLGSCLSAAFTPMIYGIYLNWSNASRNEVFNNSVILDGGMAPDPTIYGIYDYSSSEDFYQVYHNSVSINDGAANSGQKTGSGDSPSIFYNETAAMYRESTAYFDMENNTLANFRSTTSGGNNYCFNYYDTTNFSSDYNNLYSSGNTLGMLDGFSINDLTNWQTTTGQDNNSISLNPLYTSNNENLAPAAGSPLPGAGTGLDLVPTDIDGILRDPVNPTIGCHEVTSVIDKTWNGLISSDWNISGNWTPSGEPGPSENILIPAGTPYNCVITTSAEECHDLTIDDGAVLTLSPTGNLTIMGTLYIRPDGLFRNYQQPGKNDR